ncbi:MAG: group III truncated hemoglobin [Crocinitomicaceae bacterium]
MKEIENAQDVHELVSSFYKKVMSDDVIGPFFRGIQLEEHLPKMEFFWRFVLLDESGYTTSVTDKHMHMRLKKEHFDRWLLLFYQTLDELFTGEKVNLAKQRASLIGWTIQSKM